MPYSVQSVQSFIVIKQKLPAKGRYMQSKQKNVVCIIFICMSLLTMWHVSGATAICHVDFK